MDTPIATSAIAKTGPNLSYCGVHHVRLNGSAQVLGMDLSQVLAVETIASRTMSLRPDKAIVRDIVIVHVERSLLQTAAFPQRLNPSGPFNHLPGANSGRKWQGWAFCRTRAGVDKKHCVQAGQLLKTHLASYCEDA
jgi:hypothetical protein